MGYLLGSLGGSAFCQHNIINLDGSIEYNQRIPSGINTLNSISYRKSFYYYQNDLYPSNKDDKELFKLKSDLSNYNRMNFAKSLLFKSSLMDISY